MKIIKKFNSWSRSRDNLNTFSKIWVDRIFWFTMLVILGCMIRNNSNAYSLAKCAMTNMWKIGGVYMCKSLIETFLEKLDLKPETLKMLLKKG